MTATDLRLSFEGLVTALGDLQSPTGGFATAQNVNFPAPGQAERRKGVRILDQAFGGPTWEAKDPGFPIVEDGTVFLQTGDASYPQALWAGNGVDPSSIFYTPKRENSGDPSPLSLRGGPHVPWRMRMAQLNNAYFFTGWDGPVRLVTGALPGLGVATQTPFAGVPQSWGFNPDMILDGGGAPAVVIPDPNGFLLDGGSCAYRVLWGFYSATPTRIDPVPPGTPSTTPAGDTDQFILGAPSGRYIVSNIASTPGYTGSPVNVALRVLVPKQARCFGFNGVPAELVDTNFFLRVYRSQQVDYASSVPSDEMRLCLEYRLTATDIANGYVEFSTFPASVPAYPDSCPDNVRGENLYTNRIEGGDLGTLVTANDTVSIGLGSRNDIPPQAWEVANFGKCLFYGNLTLPARAVISLITLPALGDALFINGVKFRANNVLPPAAEEYYVQTALSLSENIEATARSLCDAINLSPHNEFVVATYVGDSRSPGTVGQIIIEARTIPQAFILGTSSTALRQAFLPNIPLDADGGQTFDVTQQTNGIAISKPLQGDAVPPANFTSVGPRTCTVLAMASLQEALYVFTDAGIYRCLGQEGVVSSFRFDLFDPTFRLWGPRSLVQVGESLFAWCREGIVQITSGGIRKLDVQIRNYVQKIEHDLGFDAVRHCPKMMDAFAVGYKTARRVIFFTPQKPDLQNAISGLQWNIDTQTWSQFVWDENPGGAKSCGAVRTLDEICFWGTWNSASSDSRLYVDRNTNDLGDYADSIDAGEKPIIVILRWNTQAPDPKLLQRWRECTLFLSPSQVNTAYTALPSSVGLTFQTEAAGPSAVGIIPGNISVRTVVPRDVAMGVRMDFTVTCSTINEYLAICGCVFLYEPMSTGATK